MLALRKTAAEPGLRLDEIPVPEPAPDEVLVEVETASVCGTDLHIYGWDEWSQQRIHPPLTLGHEFAGTIAEFLGVRAVDEPISPRRPGKRGPPGFPVILPPRE